MDLQILGHTKDLRTNTFVLYAQISINDYLDLVGENFDEFLIQRRREKHKAYARMKKDITEGAVLPPITLALQEQTVKNILPLLNDEDFFSKQLIDELIKPNQVFILDGMQRTYILSDLRNEQTVFKKNQKLLIEFWVESNINNLSYRLIILNAGQKPMSLRHQLDLLFSTMYRKMKEEIPSLELIREKDEQRRNRPKKFSFEYLVSSYYCFLAKNYTPNKENIIAQEIQDEDIIYADETKLTQDFELFKKYLKYYIDLDEQIYRIYISDSDSKMGNFFAREPVMNAFFAALSGFAGNNEEKRTRIIKSLEILLNSLQKVTDKGLDPLYLLEFGKIIEGIPSSKKNIGLATKQIIYEAFCEFFNTEGSKSMSECWKFAQ